MEILYGLGGVVSLGLFAAILGFDVRDMLGPRSKSDDASWMYDDPNSTISVTRDVLAEKAEQLRTTRLTLSH